MLISSIGSDILCFLQKRWPDLILAFEIAQMANTKILQS